jgi:hypothetical protein
VDGGTACLVHTLKEKNVLDTVVDICYSCGTNHSAEDTYHLGAITRTDSDAEIARCALVAADLLDDRVVPFFEQHDIVNS